MLISLSVKNFTLIDNLEIDFFSNFSTITGETGAGKSIILDALGLILGERADLNALKNSENKCIIEASFQIKSYNIQPVFESLDIDYEDLTIIRREIHPNGKSRAFINDSPINLSDLQIITEKLIDIHSQSQTRDLENSNYQVEILDIIAGSESILNDYKICLKEFKSKRKIQEELINNKQQLFKDQEYNNFLFQELNSIDLENIDFNALEEESNQLNNLELINENILKFLALNEDENYGLQNLLSEANHSIQKIINFSSDFQQLFERLVSIEIELKDVFETINQLKEKLIFDPNRFEYVNQTMSKLFDLQKKHQVTSVNELVEIKKELQEKIFSIENIDYQIEEISNEIIELEKKLNNLAEEILKNRVGASKIFKEKVEYFLNYMGMNDAFFEFNFLKAGDFLENGKDKLDLFFSANKGGNLGTLKKVASGGEKSRIMLAIKTLLAEYAKLPTIIFDEIDTGVSGEIAIKMGDLMKKMSLNRQVFSITHLPQIAAKGDHHYKVYKENKGEITSSNIIKLEEEYRVNEIAEMLSGKEISDSAISHAKTLLK